MEKLITYLNRSHSPYHAVEYSKELLKEAGFEELKLDECWKIDKGGKYYVDCYLSSLYAFTVGEEPYGMLRLAAAHTDYPCFRIKPDAVIKSGGAVKLNIEPYGGGIYSTWLDRALSMAGIVCARCFSQSTCYVINKLIAFGFFGRRIKKMKTTDNV